MLSPKCKYTIEMFSLFVHADINVGWFAWDFHENTINNIEKHPWLHNIVTFYFKTKYAEYP